MILLKRSFPRPQSLQDNTIYLELKYTKKLVLSFLRDKFVQML
jgi:hypothetical protein